MWEEDGWTWMGCGKRMGGRGWDVGREWVDVDGMWVENGWTWMGCG